MPARRSIDHAVVRSTALRTGLDRVARERLRPRGDVLVPSRRRLPVVSVLCAHGKAGVDGGVCGALMRQWPGGGRKPGGGPSSPNSQTPLAALQMEPAGQLSG
jgi:hypothetical protein